MICDKLCLIEIVRIHKIKNKRIIANNLVQLNYKLRSVNMSSVLLFATWEN